MAGVFSPAYALTQLELIAKLESAGYSQIREVKSTAEGIPVKAMKNGKEVSLVVDSGGQRWPLFPPKRTFMRRPSLPLCANNGLMHRSKLHSYSITSSARVSSVGGTMMSSAFAVFRLITSSYLVGCSTGRSAGFAPLKILSTKTADRR
jgi:hypothetical protein